MKIANRDAAIAKERVLQGECSVNGYIAFYRGKQIEVYANTTYEAQSKAAAMFKARKSHEVTVMLAERDGQQVVHSTGGL